MARARRVTNVKAPLVTPVETKYEATTKYPHPKFATADQVTAFQNQVASNGAMASGLDSSLHMVGLLVL